MTLPKQYDPKNTELRLLQSWQTCEIYHFKLDSDKPIYSIDTPPPTVSGNLHLGHVYSYSHVDFIARYQRMRGKNVFYPMGYDDNGLPTERLVEKRLGIKASQVGRTEFIKKCLQISEEAELEYQQLWQRLGLSIDWRYTYRTIDDRSRRINQASFIDLYRKGLAYRRQAPAIWCPECQTALAQADLNDFERLSEFVTLRFDFSPLSIQDKPSDYLKIATTRPELLPACVAVFIHPEDGRYKGLAGRHLNVPLFGQKVPIIEDPDVDPEKGSGAVMCCTFGDAADVAWWYKYHLPTLEAIEKDGRMAAWTDLLAELTLPAARQQVKQALDDAGLIIERRPTRQTIRVHERCDTPVEYVVLKQWFIRLLDFKRDLIKAGMQVGWHPEHMLSRYRIWVENLNWDWCISRQRYFGVPFPVWYCKECGQIRLAEEDQLPVDPTESQPPTPCSCGSSQFEPEEDVQDTWATSSLSPQIVGDWLVEESPLQPDRKEQSSSLYDRVFPFSLRPQAHEIIRTWAFYTIVKSNFHFSLNPWKEVLISGWGLAGEGSGKISKSRGGGPISPQAMIERYSADAVRYWAASTGPGKDALISEEKVQMGARLVTKLWNVARFSERFLIQFDITALEAAGMPNFTSADLWILSSLQRLIRRTGSLLDDYEYAAAKSEIENFFWNDLADNYLEMCKQRLYDAGHPGHLGACYTLYKALLTILKLFAPYLPYVTEEIFLGIFHDLEDPSIHTSAWPEPDLRFEAEEPYMFGELLVGIATAARRYKSEHNLPLGKDLGKLQLALVNGETRNSNRSTIQLLDRLTEAVPDLLSVTRASQIEIKKEPNPSWVTLYQDEVIQVAVEPSEPVFPGK